MQEEATSFLITLRATFNGAPLTAVDYGGKPAWIASEVGRALGLADPRDAAELLTSDPECEDGLDYLKVEGAALADVKDKTGSSGLVDPRARHLILLTEPGLWRVLGVSRAPASAAFRRWLYREHLPALRAGHAAPIPKQIAATPAQQMVALAREGTRIGSVFTVDYLAAELAHARAERKLEAARQREIEQAHRRESDRFFRDERARQKAARKRPTTLW